MSGEQKEYYEKRHFKDATGSLLEMRINCRMDVVQHCPQYWFTDADSFEEAREDKLDCTCDKARRECK